MAFHILSGPLGMYVLSFCCSTIFRVIHIKDAVSVHMLLYIRLKSSTTLYQREARHKITFEIVSRHLK